MWKQKCLSFSGILGLIFSLAKAALASGKEIIENAETIISPSPCQTDVLFILDSSSSVQKDFEASKNAILTLSQIFNIGPQAARVAVIQYSGQYRNWVTIPFGRIQSNLEFNEIISKLKHLQGITLTGKALKIAHKMLTAANPTNVRKPAGKSIVILVTDGYAQDQIDEVSLEISNLPNTLIYTIALSEKYKKSELELIAGSPTRAFYGSSPAAAENILYTTLANELFQCPGLNSNRATNRKPQIDRNRNRFMTTSQPQNFDTSETSPVKQETGDSSSERKNEEENLGKVPIDLPVINTIKHGHFHSSSFIDRKIVFPKTKTPPKTADVVIGGFIDPRRGRQPQKPLASTPTIIGGDSVRHTEIIWNPIPPKQGDSGDSPNRNRKRRKGPFISGRIQIANLPTERNPAALDNNRNDPRMSGYRGVYWPKRESDRSGENEFVGGFRGRSSNEQKQSPKFNQTQETEKPNRAASIPGSNTLESATYRPNRTTRERRYRPGLNRIRFNGRNQTLNGNSAAHDGKIGNSPAVWRQRSDETKRGQYSARKRKGFPDAYVLQETDTKTLCSRRNYRSACDDEKPAQFTYRWYYNEADQVCSMFPWGYCKSEPQGDTLRTREACQAACINL